MAENILRGTIKLDAPGVQQTANNVTASVTKMQQSLSKTTPALNATGTAVAKTSKDFTGLARVIQDLPFGFIGIQNNLTQLLPAAGALGLGLSALTAGFTFAAVGLQNWSALFPSATDKIKEQVKALNDTKQALSDYVDTLDDVNKARIIGVQKAQEEIISLKVLYDATQNQNISIEKRRQLVDQLQEQYPKYFANIKDEVILAGGATQAYNQLSSAILASARARAGQDQLVDLQKQLLITEQQQLDKNRQLSDLYQKINALRSSGAKLVITSATGEERLTDAGAKMNKLQSQYNDLLDDGAKLQRTNIDLSERSKRLLKDINTGVEANPDALLNPTGKLDKEKAAKKIKKDVLLTFAQLKLSPTELEIPIIPVFGTNAGDLLRRALDEVIQRENQQPFITDLKLMDRDAILNKFKLDFLRLGMELPKIIEAIDPATGIKMKMPIEFVFNTAQLVDGLEKAKIQAKDRIESLGKSLTETLQSIGIAMATSLGEAFAAIVTGKGIADVFKSLGNQIGSALQNLGKQMIALSPVIAALKIAIKTLNPAILLPAGIGLVAIGSIIKSSLGKLPGFAQGGVVPPGYPNDTFLARLTSGERIIPAGQSVQPAFARASGGDRIIMHEVRGDSLRLWIANANKMGGLW